MTMMALTEADEERRVGLRKMKILATSLLGFAALIFALTLHRDGVWGYVNATAEAAMVGALADWFAVTALFRHPMGIPIPHTALVPRKKDFFAKSLEDFVTGHFLTGEAARERYLSADATGRLGGWLRDERHAEKVVTEVSAITERALGRIRNEEIRYLVEQSFLPRMAAEPISPVAGSLLSEVVADKLHRNLVDLLVVEAHDWLLDNPETFMAVVGQKVPAWAPIWLRDLATDRLHIEAVRWVREIRDDDDHRVRLAIDDLLRDLAVNLQEDPATMARAESLKTKLLEHPQAVESTLAMWDIIRRALVRALEDPDGELRKRLTAELVRLGERMVSDPQVREAIDTRVGDSLTYLVERYAGELAPVISQVIARWDGREAAERIELHVGRDLQFIRINGTIVGGLAGLLIHSVSQLFA